MAQRSVITNTFRQELARTAVISQQFKDKLISLMDKAIEASFEDGLRYKKGVYTCLLDNVDFGIERVQFKTASSPIQMQMNHESLMSLYRYSQFWRGLDGFCWCGIPVICNQELKDNEVHLIYLQELS